MADCPSRESPLIPAYGSISWPRGGFEAVDVGSQAGRTPHRRPLPAAGTHRQGRNGHRVASLRRAPGPHCRGQGGQVRRRPGRRGAAAEPAHNARGEGGGQVRASQRDRRSRRDRGGRQALDRHATRPVTLPRSRDQAGWAVAGHAGGGDRPGHARSPAPRP